MPHPVDETLKYMVPTTSLRLKKGFWLTLLLLLAIYPAAAQDWYDSAWTSRQKITIDSDHVDFSLSGDIVDFPYLVTLSAANDVFTTAQTDGDDILFTNSDGTTKLAHELDTYNSGGTSLAAWVRLPVLNSGADTIIYMYYGNPNTASQQQPEQVWDEDFAGVWHLDEDGTASEYQDSTWNNNTGIGGLVSSSAAPEQSTDSVSGYSQDFPNTDDLIDVGQWGVSGDELTISAWFKHTAGSGDDRFVAKTTSSAEQDHVYMLSLLSGTKLRMRLKTGAVFGSGTTTLIPSATITDNTWIYGVGKYDGSKMYLYQDGTEIDSVSKTGSIYIDDSIVTAIGNNAGGTQSIDGKLDEVRVSSKARSVDWIKSQYQMQLAAAQGAPASPGTVDTGKFIEQKGYQEQYFQYRRQITINKSKVTGTHTDFPVLIDVTLDSTHVQSANGYDVIFTDSAGVQLSHEIESYNSGTGRIIAWVKVPSIGSLADTVLYVYYGNPTITTDPSTTATWPADYESVWHLKEDPGPGGAGDIKDSTSNAVNATAQASMVAGDSISAVVGNGMDFDGTDDELTFTNGFTGTSNHTISAWVNQRTSSASRDTIFSIGNGVADQNRYIYSAATDLDVAVAFYANTYDTNTSIEGSGWKHLAWVYDGTSSSLFLDGVLTAGPAAQSGANTAGTAGSIGNATWGARNLNGQLDEVRFRTSVVSAGWITTEYNNQSDTAIGSTKFIKSFDAEEAVSWWNSSWQYRKPLTLNADKVGANNVPKNNSDLVDMPVLLSFTDTEIGGNAQYTGNDIAFTLSGTATQLDHETISFNSGTGEIIAWVRIPAISSSSDTAVDIYYGNSSAADQQDVAGTWSNGYVGVWHLEEDVRGPGGAYIDSSGSGHDGTSGAVVIGDPPVQASGKIGNGQSFDGTNDTVTVGGIDATHPLNITQTLTLSAWVNMAAVPANNKWYNTISMADASDIPYNMYLGDDITKISGDLVIGGTRRDYWLAGATTIAASQWVHVTLTFDSTTGTKLYVNSALDATETDTGSLMDSSGMDFFIGGIPTDADGPMNGLLDEARVSDVVRSTDWIKAEYVGQNTPATYLSFAAPPTLWTWTGATDNDWSIAGNWDQASVPDTNTEPAVIAAAGTPQLSANITVKRLTINSGTSIDLNGYSLFIDDVDGYENSGTVILSGGTDLLTRSDTDSGTFTYSTTAATILDYGSTDYYNLTIDGITANLASNLTVANDLTMASGGTLNLNGYTLTVNGDMTGTGTVAVGSGTLVVNGSITASTLTAGSGTIQVGGDFNTTFTAGTGTVEFIGSGGNSTIYGTNTFNTLNITVPNKTVLFQNGNTQTVTTFTATGTESNEVNLRSVTDAAQWTITPTTTTVAYAYIKDSVVSSATNAVNSTDGGNNNGNWSFNPAGVLDHFAIATVSDPQKTGQPFSVTITAEDSTNATVVGFTGTVTISDTSGSISPTTSDAFAAGVVNQSVTIDNVQAGNVITVTDGTVIGQSNSFAVEEYSPYAGLVGHWKLDVAVAYDSSVNANDGTVTEAGTSVPGGPYSLNYSFDGANDNVSVGDIAALEFLVGDPFSVAAWVKGLGSAAGDAIAGKTDNTLYGYHLMFYDTRVTLELNGLAGTLEVDSSLDAADDTWHHVAASYDGSGVAGGITLYIDGVKDTSSSIITNTAPGNMANAGSFTVGATNASAIGTYDFTGNIAHVRTYNQSLSESEVAALYNEAPPLVNSVTSPDTDTTYYLADPISVTAAFSENVYVTGTPQILLETGTTDRYATYSSGSGSSTLTFAYTVQGGDTSADLEYVATDSLELGTGGAIKDSGGNDAELTLPTLATANSLGGSKAIVVDSTTVLPTIYTGVVNSDNTVSITFSENVYNNTGMPVTPGGDLLASDFSIAFTQGSGTATNATIASVSHTAGTSSATLTLTITGTPNGQETVEITPAATSIYNASDAAARTSETSGVLNLKNTTTATAQLATYQYTSGSSVNWTTPANVWETATPSANNAWRDIPRESFNDEANYLLGSGFTGFSGAGNITMVEIGIDPANESTDASAYIRPILNGTESSTTHVLNGTTVDANNGVNAILYSDVTTDSGAPATWVWADVEDMDVKIWGFNVGTNSERMLYVYQVWARVTYDLYLDIGNVEDEDFYDGETGVTIDGMKFGAVKGAGKVELASSSNYSSATKVEQTTGTWSETQIDFTANLGSLSPGTLYLFVTIDTNSELSEAYEIQVSAADAISITNVGDGDFLDGETGITIAGQSFGATQGTGKVELADSLTYSTATKVEQNVSSWADTSVDFTVNLGVLSVGSVYVFLTDNNGDRTAGFEVQVSLSAGQSVVFAYTAGATGGGWTTTANAWDSTPGNAAVRDVPKNTLGTADEANYLQADTVETFVGYGDISSVEIGIDGYVEGFDENEVDIRPVFDGVPDAAYHQITGETLGEIANNSIHYLDITSDAGAPGTWTWLDVERVDAKIWGEDSLTNQARMVNIDQVHLRVQYQSSSISIIDIEDEDFLHGETAVTITGKSFGSSKGL